MFLRQPVFRCQSCACQVSRDSHESAMNTRSALDFKLHREVEKEFDMRTRAAAADEIDVAGNPVFCIKCLGKAITKARAKR